MFIEEERNRLEACDINELRVLGKNLMLKSPTSLSKEELIEEILKMVYGDSSLVEIETRGRSETIVPYKRTNAGEYSRINTGLYSKTNVATNTTAYEIVGRKEKSNLEYGFVELDGKGAGFVYKKNGDKAFLNSGISLLKKIETDDYIGFESGYSFVAGGELVSEIESINGKDIISGIKRKEFSKLKPVLPQNELTYFRTNYLSSILKNAVPAYEGGRILIGARDNIKKQQIIEDLIEAFPIDNLVTAVFPVITSDDDFKERLIRYAPNLINARSSNGIQLDLVLKAFKRAERFVEFGEKAVIILDDLNALFKTIRDEFGFSDEQAKDEIVKLLEKGSSYNSKGSLTIFAFLDENENKLLSNSLTSVGTTFFTVSDKISAYPHIDLVGSASAMVDYFLGIEEIKEVQEIKNIIKNNSTLNYKDIYKALSYKSRDKAIQELKNL